MPVEKVKAIPARIAHMSGISAQRARQDTTALLIAKMVHMHTGEHLVLEETMTTFLNDPERAGSVILTLMNLVAQFATQSMTNPNGLKQLVDYLISESEKGAEASVGTSTVKY